MPLLGAYAYPLRDLDEVIEMAIHLAELGGKTSLSAFARKMKMSERGGAFLYRVAALVDYGVAERVKGELRLTQLGQRLAKPIDDEDLAKAKVEAFFNVPLFKKLHEIVGNRTPEDSDLMAHLINITGQDRISVSKALPHIRRIYRKAVSFLPSIAGPPAKPEEVAELPPARPTIPVPTFNVEKGVLVIRIPSIPMP